MNNLRNYTLIFFLVLALTSCVHSTTTNQAQSLPSSESVKTDSLYEEDPIIINNTDEKGLAYFNSLKDYSNFQYVEIPSKDSTLPIPTDTGTVHFKTSKSSNDTSYLRIQIPNLLFIHEETNDGIKNYKLISKKTGQVITVPSLPVFSLNHKSFVSHAMNKPSERIPSGYQVWQLKADTWVKTDSIHKTDWVPLGYKWINNSEIYIMNTFTRAYKDGDEFIEKNLSFEKVKIKD